MIRLVLAASMLVGCEQPAARFTYAVSDDPATSCGTTACSGVKLPCDAVISIRIVDPDDPTSPEWSTCEPLPQNRDRDLCAISTVSLGAGRLTLPAKTLEFQMVIWPRSEVETETGELDCAKHEVKFDAVYGFPVSQDPTPAIGGHTYYHPGDEEVRVELGCTNLDSLTTCNPSPEVEFRTSVRSFDDLNLFLSQNQGRQLVLELGEPKLRGAEVAYSLRPDDLHPMILDLASPFAALWSAVFDPQFIDIVCTQVLARVAESTPAVKCGMYATPAPDTALNLPYGVLVPKLTLDEILMAGQLPKFPTNGMTIGIVVDENFSPRANQVVTVSGGTVRYLSSDRSNLNATMTSDNGIFVSLDAEFRTKFGVAGSIEEIGGRIQDLVTIVVLHTD